MTSLDRLTAATLAAALGLVVASPASGQSVWPKPAVEAAPVGAAMDAADADDAQGNNEAKAEANAPGPGNERPPHY